MTESLFSLGNLREQLADPMEYFLPTRSESLALIEAVEAARTLRSWERAFEPEHRGVQDIKSRLDEKLEAFGEL